MKKLSSTGRTKEGTNTAIQYPLLWGIECFHNIFFKSLQYINKVSSYHHSKDNLCGTKVGRKGYIASMDYLCPQSLKCVTRKRAIVYDNKLVVFKLSAHSLCLNLLSFSPFCAPSLSPAAMDATDEERPLLPLQSQVFSSLIFFYLPRYTMLRFDGCLSWELGTEENFSISCIIFPLKCTFSYNIWRPAGLKSISKEKFSNSVIICVFYWTIIGIFPNIQKDKKN